MHKNCGSLLVLLSVIAASVPASTRAGVATIYDLGNLGGTDTVGVAINADGQVAGLSYTTGGSAYHTFLYTGTPGIGGAMADLGTLGGTSSQGLAINASGQVAGTSVLAGGDNSGPFRAFLYTGNPSSGGSMADLGTLPGGTYSEGKAINNSGQVVGYGDTAGGAAHAFIYTGTPGRGGAMADLGTLGGMNGCAYAINTGGQVAGVSGTAGNSMSHAFRYTGTSGRGGAMADLGTLGGAYSYGFAINASGQVAGMSYTAATVGFNQHAFLYTGTPGVDGHLIDLNTWLVASNPTEGAAWTLVSANAISDTGLITGYGYYNGGPGGDNSIRAFLLDASALLPSVPEPGCRALLSLRGLTFLHRRSRRVV